MRTPFQLVVTQSEFGQAKVAESQTTHNKKITTLFSSKTKISPQLLDG